MRNFWRTHTWPESERRLHLLVVFGGDKKVRDCYKEHVPLLGQYRHLLDIVPPEWLHMTVQSLCPITSAAAEELDELVRAVRDEVLEVTPPIVQLGPARTDGGAVTWAVYPETGLVDIHARVRKASLETLGNERVSDQRNRWWPHVTLAYGAVDEPADDLDAALARAGLPRVGATISELALVDQEQDLGDREYRWREIATVPIGPLPASTAPRP
jgi:2'-5' RNA ligase